MQERDGFHTHSSHFQSQLHRLPGKEERCAWTQTRHLSPCLNRIPSVVYVSKMTNENSFSLFFLTYTIHANELFRCRARGSLLSGCISQIISRGARARAMRMLSDGPAADDASTAPLLVTPTPASVLTGRSMLPPEGGGGASMYPDSNMVIILAALFCVLICALGLNSLLRYARHCGRSLAMGAAPATTTTTMVVAAPVAPGSGLNKRDLRKIPVVEYETRAGGVPDTECVICLGEFVDGEKVPRCHHGFHVRCIDRWLAVHSSSPICRNSLLEEDHGAGKATVAGEAT